MEETIVNQVGNEFQIIEDPTPAEINLGCRIPERVSCARNNIETHKSYCSN